MNSILSGGGDGFFVNSRKSPWLFNSCLVIEIIEVWATQEREKKIMEVWATQREERDGERERVSECMCVSEAKS